MGRCGNFRLKKAFSIFISELDITCGNLMLQPFVIYVIGFIKVDLDFLLLTNCGLEPPDMSALPIIDQ